MKNFRQYRDTKIEFSRSPSNNITIIEGANGAGKTNIMNAITWCLFGKELHIDSKYAGLPIVNTTTLEESRDEICEMMVEIQFIQSNGKKLHVNRTCQYKKGKDGELTEIGSGHSLTVMSEAERDWGYPLYGDEAQYMIDNLIPPSIEEYFFFDGERMDDYFKENTGRDIKDAVFKISQLELFEKLIDHLSARRNDFLRTAKGLNSKASELRDMIELQTRSLETDKVELQELTDKKNEEELLEREFSEKLNNSSADHIRSLGELRDTLDSQVDHLKNEIGELEEERLELLHRSMPIIFSYEALAKTKAMIDSRREAGMIPPPYRTIFISNLLRKGKCICGSDIAGKDEYSAERRRKVETYLQESELSDMSNDLIESNAHIQRLIESITDFPEDVINIGKKLKTLQGSKNAKEEKIDKISQEIKQSNLENIKLWEQKRSEHENKRKDLEGKIAVKKNDIERRQNIIRGNRIKFNEEIKKEEKHNWLLKVQAFCDKGIKCAEEVRDTIMETMKKEIEEKTSRQFLSLIWKKETYKAVKIDGDYNISVEHVSGMEGLGTLSAGEREVCALSFMAALNSVSGFEVPLVVDTPLARISTEPSRNIAENLPNYLKGKQLTLLVTEKEYSPEVQKALSDALGKVYIINVEEKEHGNLAEVELVKWPKRKR
jgi:DNA sulfur modification protein DndD